MPDSTTRILDPELIAKIGKLTVKAREVVDGVLTGLHKSPQHGSSIEFAEHKEYSHGDDIRHMDWKAYARFDRYYIKKFEDETNLRSFLMVDASDSMGYGEGIENKLEYARILAAAFAFLLLRQQDSPALLTFSDKLETYIPPRATMTHYQELIESLVRLSPKGETRLKTVVEQAAERIRGRSMAVVFSDFFDPDKEAMRLLARMKAKKNEVILFHVLHKDELEFPFDYLTEFEDMETSAIAMAEPDAIRAEYLKIFSEFTEGVRNQCLQNGIGYHFAPTYEPPEKALLSFLLSKGGGQ